MKVLVIGSGLIGLTVAYALNQRGYEVAVVDREAGPGLETSFANGALLTPSMSQPWNTPGCWRVVLSSLVRADAALKLCPRALPSLLGWGFEFLRNSTPARFEEHSRSNLRLALYSRACMAELQQNTNLQHASCTSGSLKVFRSTAGLAKASTSARRLASEGLTFKLLTVDQTISLEPALAPIASELAGALHYELDEIGDAYAFCVALAKYLAQGGVTFRFGTNVHSLRLRSGAIDAVVSQAGLVSADHYVIAAGSYSTELLRPLRINLPVRPAKGYSVSFPISSGQSRKQLRTPIVDDDMHAAIVPLKDAIRVAGTAEFAGFDLTLEPARVRSLTRLAQRLLPDAQLDPSLARSWCGLRALSADGVAVIGRTMVSNLWVSTGHGHLGWTTAAGSACLLADLMTDQPPAIDPRAYDPRRFPSLGQHGTP